jgi:hypothetical protein
MPIPFINDGYVATATVPARGPYGSLTLRYRPAMPEDVYEYLSQPRVGKKALQVNVNLLMKHLVSWDVADNNDDSKTMPVTPENLKRMPPSYIDEMVAIVTSYSTIEQEADVKN